MQIFYIVEMGQVVGCTKRERLSTEKNAEK